MSVMQKSPSGRRQHRHGRSSVPNINTPLLNADSDGFGNQDSAFYGLTDAKLSDLELAKLIQAMRSDDAEAFETFTYESIQTLGINVALIKLPMGRTPLHYAAQTNLPAVVMLLARDITSLHVQDNFGKLAEDFCQRQRLDNIRDFLFEQSKAPSTTYVTDIDDLDMDFVTTVEMNGNPNTTSLALHFEAYLCTRVNPLYCYRGQTYCECCDEAYNHEEFSGNPTLDNLIASRNERFIKRPTNTFGQFETPCSNVMAEFVRMTDDTPMEDLEKLFFHLWNLRKPGLVLTLHGSVPVTKMSQRRCYNLIFNVFQKTLTWIITDGQYGSVAEVMSMGMSGYSEAYGLKRLQAIGIVPWRRLPFQSDLRSLNYMVGFAGYVQNHVLMIKYIFTSSFGSVEGSTQVSFPQRGLKSELHTPLAPFHTRYLFIDSGAKNDIHCIQDFRTRFEVWLSKVNFRPKNCTISHNTPVCGLLVSGRPEDALGVCEALKQNIPFVVVAVSNFFSSQIFTLALFQDVSKKYSWKPRLKLAMELNQTDIVLEEILADSQLTTDDMAPFAKSSLLTNKLQFLRLLCDAGLNLYEFSDQKTVEELFTIELNRNSVGGRALKQFFQHYNSKMISYCVRFVALREITILLVDLSNSIQYQKECESYVQYLYLWSLASNRFEIAQYLLTMLTDITAAALFGASFLRRKARIARSLTDRDELKNYSLMFEDMALSVLNQCYASNVESTMQLLIMERRSFGKLSCFMLAAEGNCKNFMEHQACQEYLDRVWAHTLLVKASSFQFFLSLFVGAICPPIIPFVAEYDETRYSQNPSNSDDEVAYFVLFCLFALNLQFEITFTDYGWMAVEICVIIMATAHFIDFVRTAFTKWISWRVFLGRRTNQFVLATFFFYGVGVTIQVLVIQPVRRTFALEQFGRICIIFAASFPYQKLLLLLSINRYIGPKLQMIRKMVVRDLLPFLVIVLMFWTLYTIVFSAIILRPSSPSDVDGALSRILRIMRTGFFQMFGEFDLEELLSHYGLFNYRFLAGDDPKRKNQLDGTSQWFQRYATRGHQDKRLNVIRRLLPRDITIQSLSQARMKKTVMEQKIDNIDRTLESIMSLQMNDKRSQTHYMPFPLAELPPSLITSRQSLGAWNEGSEAPTSFQWHNHQLAFYATINADVVPHTLDPPVPWEASSLLEPFPDYVPLRWNPDTNLVPAWQVTVDQLSPRKLNVKRLSQHMLSVDSTALTFASSGSETIPRNPEGRVGTSGKGILPQFGENPACVVVVTRTGWANFLCRHERDCSQISCFKEMVRAFCQKLNSVASRSEDAHSTILRKLIGGYNKHIHVGAVTDPINCDNAWLDITVVHFKITTEFPTRTQIEQVSRSVTKH
ncbi:unnamed protein product [Mesocestoides corti]|uniref:TRPM SLOG domain-containing protein n=1 Tax=Mesocestoides corti TaxID=53468 RepID=A0A0R3UE60_MESCO|nr:unnamed protein product [Mesocestoides corti]